MSAAIPSSEKTPDTPAIRPVIDYDVVIQATGKSRATIDRMVKRDPDFPKPHRLGTFSAVFYADEFAAYMNNLPRASDAPVHHGGKVHLHKKPMTKQRARRTA